MKGKDPKPNAPRHDKYQGLARYPDGSWGIDCRLGNRRVRRKVGSETEARNELQRVKVAYRAGEEVALPPPANSPPPGAVEKFSMGDVLASYRDHVQGPTERLYCKKWADLLGQYWPEEITVKVLRPFVRALLESISLATVHRQIDVLRAAYNDGRRTGMIPASLANPLEDRKALGLGQINNMRLVEVSEEQEGRFALALGPFWWPYARFSLLTGIRFGNLAGLLWVDVNWEREYVMLEKVKSRPKMRLPLGKEAMALLRAQRDRQEADGLRTHYCFPAPQGGPLHRHNFRKRVWLPAMEAAGIPRGVRWHDLRHTMASRLVEATGGDLYLVRDALGHASYKTTERHYAHVAQSRLREAVGLLSKDSPEEAGGTKKEAPRENSKDLWWATFWALRTGYGHPPIQRWIIEHL